MIKKIISLICVFAMMLTVIPTVMSESTPAIEITTENTANVFYDSEIAKFNVSISGMTSDADISYNIYFKNYDDDNYVSEIEPVLVDSTKRTGQNVTDEIYFDLGNQKYGLYDFEVVIKSGDSVILEKTVPFAKSVKSEKQNDTFGACVHLTRYADPDTTFELMKNAGFGIARDDFNWSKYEQLKGRYALTQKQKDVLVSARKYDIDMLAILTGENANYQRNHYSTIPDDKAAAKGVTGLDAYANYVGAFLKEPLVQDTVTHIEIINEPLQVAVQDGSNEAYFNAGKLYGEVLKRGYIAAKDANPKVQVGGFSLFKTGYESEYFLDGALSVMDKPYYDALSFHHYMEMGHDGDPEPGADISSETNWWPHLNCAIHTVKRSDDYMTGERVGVYSGNTYDFELKDRWYTERGFSTDDKPDNVNPYYNQALNLVRSKAVLDTYPEGDMRDIFWIYDFSDDNNGNSAREDSFGIVESYADENAYSPKPAFIAVSNYNSLVADAVSCEKADGVDECVPTGKILSSNREELEFSGDFKYIYKYTCPERDVYMLWHSIGENPAQVETLKFNKISGEVVTYYDFWGNELEESDVYDGTSYKLTKQPYYIVVGEPRDTSREHKAEFDKVIIEGNIASKTADKNVSLVITDGSLSEDVFSDPIYVSQIVTGKGGYFSFVAEVPTRTETCNAYLVSEDNSTPISIEVDPKRIKHIEVSLISNMLKIEGANLSFMDLTDTEALIEYSTGTDGVEYSLYFAMYNKGQLTGLTKASGRASGNTDAQVIYDVSVNENIEYDKVSAFLWDAENEIIPLCEAVTAWK